MKKMLLLLSEMLLIDRNFFDDLLSMTCNIFDIQLNPRSIRNESNFPVIISGFR